MILYRCGTRIPEGVIPPSNWAMDAESLHYFLYLCEEKMIACGDKIIVIEIPDPKPEDIGPYVGIRNGNIDIKTEFPFGEREGWWSFNRPHHQNFKILEVIELKNMKLDDDEAWEKFRKKYKEVME